MCPPLRTHTHTHTHTPHAVTVFAIVLTIVSKVAASTAVAMGATYPVGPGKRSTGAPSLESQAWNTTESYALALVRQSEAFHTDTTTLPKNAGVTLSKC